MIEKNNIPKELQNLRQWVCWRLEQDKRSGRDCKVPYSPKTGRRASPSNSETWGSLDEALNCVEKYLFSGILRGDYETRMKGYSIGRQNGWLSANDIRSLEKMNPIPAEEGGDKYLVNGNMVDLKEAGIAYRRDRK